MHLRRVGVERFKGYEQPAVLELCPLTLLVGRNNAGKSGLARAIDMLAGGLLAPEGSAEPLPFEHDGLRHAYAFEDLVTHRSPHGWLKLSASFDREGTPVELTAKVQNVSEPGRPAERYVSSWTLACGEERLELTRQGIGPDDGYDAVHLGHPSEEPPRIAWRGLVPDVGIELPSWSKDTLAELRQWARGVRHLCSPRRLAESPFRTPDRPPVSLGWDGRAAPHALAADRSLREQVRRWYELSFGVGLVVSEQGPYSDLRARLTQRATAISLEHAGQGLSHILPVVVLALTSQARGPGVDIVEHPEAELHPGAHAGVAELLLQQLAGPSRPLVVETHSEMLLLRARRWVAEGKLTPEDVGIYWVESDPDHGSTLRRIPLREDGEVEAWPEGVFYEDYEEILMIRRAARGNS